MQLQILAATVASLMFAVNTVADVAVDKMFSGHMVLQREMAVPIWGTADAGAKVTAKFRNQSKEATAGQDGKWMLTALDLGTRIHPACKSGYGKRASIVALGTAYGRDIPVYGSVYESHKTEGNTLRVSFDHVGSGLAFKHADTIRGFEIAGSDGKWEWANAKIDGKTIILNHQNVKAPTMVQYAFQTNRNFAHLYNKEGWPALMFTTGTDK